MRPPRTLIEPKRRESPRLCPAKRDGAVYACWPSVARGVAAKPLRLRRTVRLGFVREYEGTIVVGRSPSIQRPPCRTRQFLLPTKPLVQLAIFSRNSETSFFIKGTHSLSYSFQASLRKLLSAGSSIAISLLMSEPCILSQTDRTSSKVSVSKNSSFDRVSRSNSLKAVAASANLFRSTIREKLF